MLKRMWHSAVVKYLRQSAGAFHFNAWGRSGRYVVLMTEGQYYDFTHLQNRWAEMTSKREL